MHFLSIISENYPSGYSTMSDREKSKADHFALVDCNNFYVSCERLFNPSLEGRPVIVLSNNDGCVISRSEEAKSIGIKMGMPAFTIPDIIEKHKVKVFSTNYTLYGDISHRIMNILSSLYPEIEIYSIDEAFILIRGMDDKALWKAGENIRKTILQWTGIPVSTGIGTTKTLAKAASHHVKNSGGEKGVYVAGSGKEQDVFLQNLPVQKVWGVGEKYALFFQKNNIYNAYALKRADAFSVKNRLGVMGQRIVLELNGVCCYPLNNNPEEKKEVCLSRSFGKPIIRYDDLEAATVNYAGTIAGKLRKMELCAGDLLVFVMTGKYARGPQYVNYKIIHLPVPANNAPELIHYTIIALKQLFRDGYQYKKSGVIASGLVPAAGRQLEIWNEKDHQRSDLIQSVMDNVNRKTGNKSVKLAIENDGSTGKMKQEMLSPKYTTSWEGILQVKMDDTESKAENIV
ncbi:MAG: Y-family DNA polymerase [Bacteroidales bacterium]|nr:Y-family DNA polymerase [Bacteroidales bacterium]